MTITIEPPIDLVETITQAATQAGLTLEQYTLHVLVRQTRIESEAKQKADDYDKWEKRLIAFANRHDPLPQPIPLEALRRENIYEE